MNAKLNFKNDMLFECVNGDITTFVQGPTSETAKTYPSPKELLLNAMMSCTAMDTLSILRKMRQNVDSFTVTISATKNTEHPIHFKSAELVFDLKGGIELSKAIKAAQSSLTKYCGINYMISKVCKIHYKIIVNNISSDPFVAHFTEPTQ